MTYSSTNFTKQVHWNKNFVQKSNTTKADWQQFDLLARQLGKSMEHISNEQRTQLEKAFGATMTTKTLQGFAFTKPHGYAGDYEMIDKLYTLYTSPDKRFRKWDEYMHSIAAAKAVRNRKTYVKKLLGQKIKAHKGNDPFEMLNIASGPGRDLFEFFKENCNANIVVDCVDLDADAINFASTLLAVFKNNINFYNKNILCFNCEKCYDLIWSAGLFDYFNDNIFKRLVRKFLKYVNPGGELVIGNFCTSNPDIDYMKLIDWHLYHRSKNDLIQLVSECGVPGKDILVEKESEGVNLFIRIKNSSAS